MPASSTKTPLPLAGWLVLCTFLHCAGWGLSTLHQLNAAGYLAVLTLGAISGLIWWKRRAGGAGKIFEPGKMARRFRRPFPAAFLTLAVLAILGGAIYSPTNYDALAYRLPRMLNWLAEGRWHWVHTDFNRLNTRGCGIEWISTPLIAFTRTDRLLFLINGTSLLLLPGLVFSVFTRVGVKPRAAWHWMWVAPVGYCYLLQAGSIGNDLFGTIFVLAAVDFALRAQKSGRVSDVCLSILAAALLSSSKASNLPLLLPWLIALAPTWRIWLAKPIAIAATAFPAMGASLLPTAVLNHLHCGDWTGLAAEHAIIGGGPKWLHFFNNATNYLLENLVPPVFPFASAWNRLADKLIPASLAPLLQKHFEPAAAHWKLGELQIEEAAGLGFGVTVLLGLSLMAVLVGRKRRAPAGVTRSSELVLRLVCIAPWIGLFYTMTKLGLSGGARYLAPYYLVLMMGLLRNEEHAVVVRRNWWRRGAFVGFGLSLLLIVISPARPLWPAGWFIDTHADRLQASPTGKRVLNVYGAFRQRANAFAPAVELLDPKITVLGLVTGDDPETSLWKPFGSRRILHVPVKESGEEIRARGIQCVLVKDEELGEPWADWMRRVNARVLHTFQLRLRAEKISLWHLVELNPQASLALRMPQSSESGNANEVKKSDSTAATPAP